MKSFVNRLVVLRNRPPCENVFSLLGAGVFLVVLFVPGSVSATGHAPAEAFIEGATLPYFGSEDRWNRRFFYEQDRKLYGRRGQRMVLDISEGRVQEAIEYARRSLDDDPADLEALFALTLAYCRLDNLSAAMKTAQEAIEKGLPVERFLAGPRNLLKPLVGSEEFRNRFSIKEYPLLHGPMLGCLTDHSARFWVRTRDEVPVQVRIYTDPDSAPVAETGTITTKALNDWTAVLETEGLQPSTKYFYEVVIGGKVLKRPGDWSFRTFPTKGEPCRFAVGFGGGAGYNPPNEKMWTTILARRPDAFLFLGDNVYIDLPEQAGPLHDYTYYRRQSRPEFRALVARVPAFSIWDDHDCGIDDVWMGPYREKPAWKPSMLKVFRNNWNNPGYGSPDWPGCWYRFTIGDVDFFLLDGRYYRTNPYGDHPTLLGPVQKAWLFRQLETSTATFKVLVSPVPWSYGAKPNHIDTWNGYREEREEIFSFLDEHRIEGVILVSADRHRSDVWKIERENGYGFYEFESSKLTNTHTHDLIPGALFGYNKKCSFGLLEFRTDLPDPTVTYRIISIDNETILSFPVRRSSLSLPN